MMFYKITFTKMPCYFRVFSKSTVYYCMCVYCSVTKETQWADPRIAFQLQQEQNKALPVRSHNFFPEGITDTTLNLLSQQKIKYDHNYKQKYKNFKASLKPKVTLHVTYSLHH